MPKPTRKDFLKRLAALAALSISPGGCGLDYLVPYSVLECTVRPCYSCEYLAALDGTAFRTEYFDGDVNRPVIVGAHGFAGTGKSFAESLPGKRRLVITFPGNQGSDFGENHSIEYDAELFEQMVNHNLDKGVLREGGYIIAGDSRGGFVVLQHAVDQAREMKAKGLEDNVGRIIIVSQDSQPNTQGFYELSGLVRLLNSFQFYDAKAQEDSLNETFGFDLRDELRQETTCNYLFIGGEKDFLMDSVQEAAENLGQRAHCYIISGAGHRIPTDELNRIIDDETPFLLQREK
ncbi:MAG: alpha/beta hydrolase [Nanoarchaeota archaeon]|nr:alpha/beta hydrolase [Nanoarchaeota archaeon]